MLFGIGAAASAIDLLKSLTSPTPASPPGKSPAFDPSLGTPPSGTITTGAGSAQSGSLSAGTMSAMLDAQGSATSPSWASDTSRSRALKHLFSRLDSDGDGKINKTEFESALGAGGTNTANADNVFDKMDADGDGAISLKEMSSALKGHHRPHAHKATASPSDPLLQALDTNTASTTDASSTTTDASSTTTTNTVATTSYNFMERALQSQTQAFARSGMPQLSVSV